MRKTVDKVKNWMGSRPCALITDEAYQLASLRHAPDMADVIWEVKRAFEKGIDPESCSHGASPTYFLKDCEGRPIAVFKKDNCWQEVAAYRLDYHHFAGVPQTVITTLEHPLWGKATGSCQYFVKEAITAVELDRRLYDNFFPTAVRRIAALDIRMMNTDRHSSNILVVDERAPIPIDHGFILPYTLSDLYFGWMEWGPAATFFSDAEISYLSLLDPEEDRRMLIDELHIDELRANRLFVSTILLKMAAIRKLKTVEIGRLMTRGRIKPLKKSHELSAFECLLEILKVRNPHNWTLFSHYVYEEVEKTIDLYEKTCEQKDRTDPR